MKNRFLIILIIITSLIYCDPDFTKKKEDDTEKIITESTVKILFIGNSLTFFNNMPDMLKEISEAAKKDFYIDQITPGGKSLQSHSTDIDTINKINERKWDYIVLQSNDITAFPDMYQKEIDNINRLKNTIKSNFKNTKIIYLMVWGIMDGVTIRELNGENIYYTYKEYLKKIYEGTLYIAKQCDTIIAPVGMVWSTVLDERPNLKYKLFDTDKAHPGYYGSYLSAITYFVTIFLEELKTPVDSIDISESDQYYFYSIANSIVLNQLNLWNNRFDNKKYN